MIYSNQPEPFELCLYFWTHNHLFEITPEMRKRAINIIITCNGVSAIFYLRSTFINYFSVGAGVWARVGGNINLPSPAMLLCPAPSSLSSSEHYNNTVTTDHWLFRRGWPRGRGRWGDQVTSLITSPGDNLLLGDPLSGVRGEAGGAWHWHQGARGHRVSGARHHPLWWHR